MRLAFDGFEIDVHAGQLFVADKEVPLERRAMDMLCYLAAHPDRLITKEELLSEVWRTQILSETVLSNTAVKLRKALGQPAGTREPIETVRGRGFRWHAVRRSSADPARPARVDPFVGRGQVMDVLERALDSALAGAGQTVTVLGAAGIGKTRTLGELAKRARAKGFSVWEGAAPDAGAPPYWLWVEVLRSAQSDLSRPVFARHLAADTWALARIVPELVPEAPRDTAQDSQAARFRLFDEIARFVASASETAPRLILADDIHWADDETLQLLAHAARVFKKHAVVLAITTREHDMAAQTPRADALRRISRQASQVELAGLSELEVGELAAAWSDVPALDTRVTELLHQRTSGNPFFVRQTLELLAQRGLSLDDRNLQGLSLPDAVRSVLRQRVLGLEPATRRVLQLAAAAGAEFDAGLLADVLGLSLAEVLAALEPARRQGVATLHASVQQRFGFGHALLRDSIYADLELAERGDYHARLGRALERGSVAGDPHSLGELARHFLLAVPCDIEACVRHARNAADAARAAWAFGTAADLLSRVCDKLAREGADPRARCELLVMLSMDRFGAGDILGTWQVLRQGAILSEQLAATDLIGRFAFQLSHLLEAGGGDEDEASRFVERALSLIGDSDPDQRALLLASRASMHFELPANERCALLDEADALAARSGQPDVLIMLAVCRASLRDPTRVDESRSAIARYRELARRYDQHTVGYRLWAEFAIELSEFLCALTRCELDAADAAIERCRALAERSQVTPIALTVELMQTGRALGDGRLDDVTAAIRRATESSSGMDGGLGMVWQGYLLRLIEAQGGLSAIAPVSIEQAIPRLEQLRPSQRTDGRLTVAWLSMKVGAHDQSRRHLASIPKPELARMPVRHGDLGQLCRLAELYAALGEAEAASALYAQLLPHEDCNAVLPAFDYCGAVARYLGILARFLGQPERAQQHFERAAAINRRLRMPERPRDH